MYIPEQGDIAWLDFEPSQGKEIIKRRPAYVLSRSSFNERSGLAIVAPITSRIRGIKLEIPLPDSLQTEGAVLVHQLKSYDYQARKIKYIEHAPVATIESVSALAQLLVQ